MIAVVSDGVAWEIAIAALIAGYAIAHVFHLPKHEHDDQDAADAADAEVAQEWGEINAAATRAYRGGWAEAVAHERPRIVLTTRETPGGAIVDDVAFERLTGARPVDVIETLRLEL